VGPAEQGGEVYYLHGDHLGSTSLATSEAGEELYRRGYYPFGEERYGTGAAQTDYGFTGQREEAYIDLIEMGARWYDSSIGRWISADTIVPNPGEAQDYNRYAYVRNNPLVYVDPSGHSAFGTYCRDNPDCQVCQENKYNDPQMLAPPPEPGPYDLLTPEEQRAVDELFDPFTGTIFDQMGDSDAYVQHARNMRWDLYEGYDLDAIAAELRDNPLNEGIDGPPPNDRYYDGDNVGGMIWWLLMRVRHKPYEFFLEELELGRGHDHLWNYEANYLEALMAEHTDPLLVAKNDWVKMTQQNGEIWLILATRHPGWDIGIPATQQ
jgi:RHS repeat-associated protein